MLINLISSIVVFIVSMGINFFLTPYILKSLGNEAYGFVGLAAALSRTSGIEGVPARLTPTTRRF